MFYSYICSMKLIADSGSTKTEWCIVKNDNSTENIITGGINPFYQSTKEIFQNLQDDFPAIKETIDEISLRCRLCQR